MKSSAGKLLLLYVFLILYSPVFWAQVEVSNLENLDEVLFSINWVGNVNPDEIGINADSLYGSTRITLYLLGPENVIDARGLSENPEQIPQLSITIDLLTAGTDHIYFAIKMELVEFVPLERLDNRTTMVATWQEIKYDLYEKELAGENLKKSIEDLVTYFYEDHLRDNSPESNKKGRR
jgi:hypothetical protein